MGKLSVLTVVLVVLAVSALGVSAKKTAKYIGSAECAVCHEDTHPAIIKAHAGTMHQGAMADASKNPKAIVAVFDSDSPINKSQVRYVLGTGRVYQNYLDQNLKVLPAKWLVKEKKWIKQDPVDGAAQCVGCHVTNFDPVSKTWKELGVGCEACHGPGGAHSESMEAGDIVNPKKLDQKKLNMVCGQCHSVGTDPAGKYAFSPTFVPGDDLDKHFKLKEPGASTPNSQYNTFLTSKHEAGGQKCTSCHDSHGDKAKEKHQLRIPINELCLGCHRMALGNTAAIPDLKSHAPTAADDATCASCHMHGGSHAFKKTSAQ
ncbi:MAG: multiheme c-type cytochrome [Armatimonadota bacterium]